MKTQKEKFPLYPIVLIFALAANEVISSAHMHGVLTKENCDAINQKLYEKTGGRLPEVLCTTIGNFPPSPFLELDKK